ncbi:hypothetical protein [Bradyrhizobium japonicum]|uniref:hypothetical protein n=1 Tax=Bradyrhizobium japonicum TaxID=375 RepID=UPI001E3C5EC9|nr:hypothetical protein [Bradyrhizobium japonicum]MCD9819776.1 hypothetical protein [Bradyrhizobium japonicum]MEB2675180.1 hypothetical protein [Bradyrhizobium japonicum]WLB25053.1 hypothetical protein QIH85_24550 [Bradyrhizobium japonicum]WRI85557.1 hypothetical protein R3F75_26615 [Bradyrhizobium japonicum]
MLTDDDIKSKLRVVFNEASSDHARGEAAAGLVGHALIALGRIAAVMHSASVPPVDQAKG